jgi:hypothetical protein
MFRTCYDHFGYVVMPFGRTNAPIVFQHLMNDVFHEDFNDFVVYYIDDIFIFSKNIKDHEHHVCLLWRNFGRLDFIQNWRSVNSINLKWNKLRHFWKWHSHGSLQGSDHC